MATPRSVKDIARALIHLAHEQRHVPEVLQDLRKVRDAFRHDSMLAIDLDETSIPLEQRQKALKRALESSVHPLVLHTLLALQTRGLLSELATVYDGAIKEAERVAHHHEAVAVSATALSKKDLQEITNTLEKKFGGTVSLEHHVDDSLGGGIRITIGDWIIDHSIAGKLTRLAHALYV